MEIIKGLLTWQTATTALSLLWIVLLVWIKFRPQDKDKLGDLYIIAHYIENNIIDVLLESFPNNKALNRVDDIVEEVLKQFKKAGIMANKEKIEKKVKEKVEQKDGFSLELDDDKKFRINYKTKF